MVDWDPLEVSQFELGYAASERLVQHLCQGVRQQNSAENQNRQGTKAHQLPTIDHLCATLGHESCDTA